MKFKLFYIFVVITAGSFAQERDLLYYMDKAQKNSPLLEDYQNQINSAKIDSLLNRAPYKPQIVANLNAGYAPIINGYGYDIALSNGQVLSGLVVFNQKIIGKKQVNSQSDASRLIHEALLLKKKITTKDLNKVITAQYITAWGTSQQIIHNEKITALLKEEDLILKKLTQNSVYRQTDYLIFNTTVKQQELTTLMLKQQYQNDLSMLNYLSGINDTITLKLKHPEITLPIIEKGPSIFQKQFEVDSLKIQNNNVLLDNAYKPSLLLLGDAGYNSSFMYDAYKNFGFSVGLSLSIPIYDGNQRLLQHQKNQNALNTISSYQANFNRQYAQQLAMLNQKLVQCNEKSTMLQSQLATVEALIEAHKKLLLTGDAQITEYIIAVGNLIAIQTQASQNIADKLQVINELNYWKSDEN